MIYPQQQYIKFNKYFTKLRKGLYRLNRDFDFEIQLPENYNKKIYCEYNGKNYTVVISQGKMFFYVRAGFLWDGVTGFFDLESLMLFSLLHDICCYASQHLRDKIFEYAFEFADYEVIRKQGAWPATAWLVQRVVYRYDSYKNRPNDPNE